MKSTRMVRLLAGGTCVLLAWPAPGTAGPRLITGTGQVYTAPDGLGKRPVTPISGVSDQVSDALNRRLQDKSTKRLALVTVDNESLKGNELTVDLFDKRTIALRRKHKEHRRSGRTVWTGTTDGYEDAGNPYASIVVNTSDDGRVVSGTIKYLHGDDYELHRITTVIDGEKSHVVLVELDPAHVARPPY